MKHEINSWDKMTSSYNLDKLSQYYTVNASWKITANMLTARQKRLLESIYFFGHRLAEADVILAAIAIN